MKFLRQILTFSLLLPWLVSCATPAPTAVPQTQKLRVLATTTLVGDVVGNITGEAVELSVLLPIGADPHSFTPTPQDVAKVSQADLIFANGAGLEEFLKALLESAGAAEKVVEVSEGIALLQGEAHSHAGDEEHAGETTPTKEATAEGEHDQEQEHATGDPHIWFDPNLVMIWVENITRTLSEKDPQNATIYQKNAEAYTAQLRELDQWIRQQVETIPPENRLLVTDHKTFGYFAERYGFTQVGAVLPGFSTLAEPSAQELAALEDTIRQLSVKAIFVGTTVNPNLAQRIAEDTGVKLVYLYTGSLSEKDGPANTYLNFMRYNVAAIVEALQ